MKCNKKYSAGALRHKVIIERETATADGSGGQSRVWNQIHSLYANIRPLNGNELFQAHQINSTVSHRITIRYNADISTKDRLIYNEREFKILAIININEMDRWMEINAKEGLVT